jgi:hypothetical protein
VDIPPVLNAAHATALGITVVVESAGMGAFSALTRAGRRRTLLNLAVAAGTNLVTHTILWYTFRRLGPATAARLWGYEAVIFLVEALIYRALCRMALWKAVVLSLVLNLATLLLGLLVWNWI